MNSRPLYGEKPYPERMDEVTHVLLIRYPPSVYVDRIMLYDKMVVFGHIERIECFPLQHYALVEFRSVHAACRAKESLQGRLFRDPRIHIGFAAEVGISSSGYRGPNMFSSVPPYGLSHSTAAGSYPGNANVIPEPTRMMTPYLQNFTHKQLTYGGNAQIYPHGNINNNMASNMGQISPFEPHMRPPFLPRPASWNNFDMRGPGGSSTNVFPPAAPTSATGSSVGTRRGTFGTGSSHHPVKPDFQSFDSGCFWRGVILKHGNHVCLARCVRIAEGIESPLPTIVNCSRMVQLEVLEECRARSVGLKTDIVYFVPDSEDFAKYTDFLHYLSRKNWAGVVILEDGSELFLVTHSVFLTKVFNISGPERIYGIVFKGLQQSTNAAMHHSQAVSSLPFSIVNDQQQESASQSGYDYTAHYHDARFPQRALHESLLTHPGYSRHLMGNADDGCAYRANVSTHGATAQPEISCRPLLLPTLASQVPKNISPSTAMTTTMSSTSSLIQYSFPDPVMHSTAEEWRPAQPVVGGTQFQDHNRNIHQASDFSNLSSNVHAMTYPNEELLAPQVSESYQFGAHIDSGNNSRMPQLFQHQQNSTTSYPHEQNEHVPQFQSATTADMSKMHFVADEMNTNTSTGMQQQQTALSGSAEGTSENDADMNQWIQSDLQLAARLLRQVRQKRHTEQAKLEIGSQPSMCPQDSDFSVMSVNAHEMTYPIPNEELFGSRSNESYHFGAHICSGNNSMSQVAKHQQNPTASYAHEQNEQLSQPQRVVPLATDEMNADSSARMQQLQTANFSSGEGTSEVDTDMNQRIQSALQVAAMLLHQIQQKEHETERTKQENDS